MYIDVERDATGTHTQWVAESGILDLFLLLGPTPAKVPLECPCVLLGAHLTLPLDLTPCLMSCHTDLFYSA